MELDKLNSKSIDEIWCQIIIEELVRQGIKYFFIAPGSRSTPLTLALARHKIAQYYIHFDERSLGYFALGYSKSCLAPSVIITTSGTAVANLFPSIIESSLGFSPIIILTADRPHELRSAGANQTIDQVKFFQNYIRWYFELPTPSEEIELRFLLATIDYAVYRSKVISPGPVHINCLFKEPFLNKPISPDYLNFKYFQNWLSNNKVFCNYQISFLSDSNISINLSPYINNFVKLEKGIIVLGSNLDPYLISLLSQLSIILKWPIFPDILSNARLVNINQNFISYYHLILKKYKIEEPQVIIRFGTRFISKELEQYIEKTNNLIYIYINNLYERFDPSHLTSIHFTVEPKNFCISLIKKLNRYQIQRTNNWISKWIYYNQKTEQKLNIFFGSYHKLSEPGIIRFLFKNWPKEYIGYLGSSMPIRDADVFASSSNHLNVIKVYSNRGASGIDGNIATSAGLSLGSKRNVLCILGDLAFLHDLGSLSLVKNIEKNIIFIIINNYGGGIFSFLPISKEKDVFEPFFTTPHKFNFVNIAKQFSFYYFNPQSYKELKEKLSQCIQNNHKSLIEVNSNREQNYEIHQWIYKLLEIERTEE